MQTNEYATNDFISSGLNMLNFLTKISESKFTMMWLKS